MKWDRNVKWIESAGNVAHSATHEQPLEEGRVKRSWVVLIAGTYPTTVGNEEEEKDMSSEDSDDDHWIEDGNEI
jgi:hypothetical protein